MASRRRGASAAQGPECAVRADHSFLRPRERTTSCAGTGWTRLSQKRQGRLKQVNRDEERSADARRVRVDAEQLGVGHHLRPADGQGEPDRGRIVQTADEVAQDVADGDGLAARAHPARSDHQRQALHQVADDLEGGAARAQNHRRAQNGHGDRAFGEDAAHLGAGAQVLGEAGRIVAQAAQVDDALHPGLGGGLGHVAGGLAVGPGEVAASAHGMDQVEAARQPRMASVRLARSVTSARHISRFGCAPQGRPDSLRGLRTPARTFSPRARSSGASLPPTYPWPRR
jgi:hypothetical protein